MAHKEGPNPAKQISCAVISVGAPDAPGAVRLAMEKLILPQLVDMVGQISRKI
jgi:molybdopterin biosynthesis enzyme MoaB